MDFLHCSHITRVIFWKYIVLCVQKNRVLQGSSFRGNTLLGKLSRLNDNRWLQCFITRANLTTGLHVIILFRCHYRQIRFPRERRPAMAASHFLFYQSRFYSMIVALSVFPMVAEGYRRHPFIVATIRWCTERGGCFFFILPTLLRFELLHEIIHQQWPLLLFFSFFSFSLFLSLLRIFLLV